MAADTADDTRPTRSREGRAQVLTASLEFSSRGDTDIIDLTHDIAATIAGCGLSDGTVTVFVPGATGAVTTLEHEPGVVEDMRQALDVIAPAERPYRHNANLGDGNGHSHVRAGLVGPSLVIPFVEGRLVLGRWQQIVFCDFDSRPRERHVVVQVMGV